MTGRLLYFTLNMPLVGLCLWSVVTKFGTDHRNRGMLFLMWGVASLVVYFQYPFLTVARNWFFKALVFYAGMVIFLFLSGFLFTFLSRGFHGFSLSDLGKTLILSVIFTGVGHTLAGPFLPLIILANWFLRHRMFPPF